MPTPLSIERIEKLVDEYLEHQGYELVDLRIGGSPGNPVVEIYADIEGGITAEDCGNLARSLQVRLRAEGYMDDGTGLVVSSPGLDRILKHERDFVRFMGRKVTVWLAEKISGRGKMTGILTGYDNGTVHLTDTEEGELAISSGRWKEIRLVPQYPDGFR